MTNVKACFVNRIGGESGLDGFNAGDRCSLLILLAWVEMRDKSARGENKFGVFRIVHHGRC